MPLVKHLFGRRIKSTKFNDNKIIVKLAPKTPGEGNQRVVVSPETYCVNMTCEYVKPAAVETCASETNRD